MTSWSSRIKICFYKLIEGIIKKKMGVKQNATKNVPLVKQNVMKLEVFIKTKNWSEERGLRKGVERG